MARRTPESEHAVEKGSLDEGHSEDRRPNHNSRLPGEEWLEGHTPEKSRIIEWRGITRGLIFAARSGLESWRESKQKEAPNEKEEDWLDCVAGIDRVLILPACSFCNLVRTREGGNWDSVLGVVRSLGTKSPSHRA